MADEQKGVALVILGVVAVIAVVGLVLLVVQDNNTAAGDGVYGGAMKQIEFPYWTMRGTPRNMGEAPTQFPASAGRDMTSNWNFNGNPARNPLGNIPSVMTACGSNSFLEPYNADRAGYYQSIGYQVVDPDGTKAGMCIYPGVAMVGGIAGQPSNLQGQAAQALGQ